MFSKLRVRSLVSLTKVNYVKITEAFCSRKLSYAHGACSQKLSPLTIGQAFENSVQKNENKIAIISAFQGIEKTFKQLNEDVDKLMAGLIKLNVVKGDRVAIWSTSNYEFAVTQFATAKLGAILVNVNPGYREKELAYTLNLVQCKVLISAQFFKTQNYVEVLERAAPDLMGQEPNQLNSVSIPSLKHLIYIDQGEDIAPKQFKRFGELINDNQDYKETISSAQLAPLNCDDIINIQFTSGTTGLPKGAALSHFNHMHNATYIAKTISQGLDSKIYCVPNPLYHAFGFIGGTLLTALEGSTVVIPAPVPIINETLKAIHNYKCSLVYGTPTMFLDIINYEHVNKFDLSSIRRIVTGGAPSSYELVQKVRTKFTNVDFYINAYGSTETSAVITIPKKELPEEIALKGVGGPIEHIEVKVIDEKGNTVPRGQPGEILARGPNIFIEYWGDEAKTREAIDKARWYHTGDVGVMNEYDQLAIVGRIKDMVIRGGENIFPKEVEDFLIGHESIADVNVVGVPDERFGEQLCACIIAKPGKEQLTRDDVQNYLKDKITKFKIPHYVINVDAFPRTVSMKVQKFELRKIAMNKLGINEK